MKMKTGEIRRVICAAFFLLLVIGAAYGSLTAFVKAFAALGDERWLAAAMFAGVIVALIPGFLWSWKRMRRYRPEERLPERPRAAVAPHPNPRKRFRGALDGLLIAASFTWFAVGYLVGVQQALGSATAGNAAQFTVIIALCAGAGLFLIWPSRRDLLKFAPADETESRSAELPAHPLSARKRGTLWTALVLCGGGAAFLLYVGCIYLTVIWKTSFTAGNGLLWLTAAFLGAGLVTVAIATIAARKLIRASRQHRGALDAVLVIEERTGDGRSWATP